MGIYAGGGPGKRPSPSVDPEKANQSEIGARGGVSPIDQKGGRARKPYGPAVKLSHVSEGYNEAGAYWNRSCRAKRAVKGRPGPDFECGWFSHPRFSYRC